MGFDELFLVEWDVGRTPSIDSMNNRAPVVFLFLLAIAIACSVISAATPIAQANGEVRRHQLFCTLLIGLLGLAYWLWSTRMGPSRTRSTVQSWSIALPGYALIQVLPLPLSLLRVLSPARAKSLDALGDVMHVPGWAPLSVTPSETLYFGLLLTACVVLFLVVSEVAGKFSAHPWRLVAPLIVIATGEACVGLVQAAHDPEEIGRGSYPIRTQYASFLDMVLPFAAFYPFEALTRAVSRGRRKARRTLMASASMGVAAVILAGTFSSLSRMAVAAALASLVLAAVLGLSRRGAWRRNGLVMGSALLVALLSFIYLQPVSLVQRFEGLNAEGRTAVWRETAHLIAAYPLFGCGLGTYESAFVQFKYAEPNLTQDYAHNDYLQFFAELGLIGYCIFAVPVGMILFRLRNAWKTSDSSVRWLGAAGAGACAAAAFHSLVDFSLYVPANMLVLAAILGILHYAGEADALQSAKGRQGQIVNPRRAADLVLEA
jgi:O-antigen ligase